MPWFIALPPIDTFQIKPLVDLRERYERFIDVDFNRDASDNRSSLKTRWRVGFDFEDGPNVKGRVMYQYAQDYRVFEDNHETENRSDLYLAYADLKQPWGTVRFGRQQLTKGSDRLLGGSDWGLVGRSWDMVRVTGKNWDAWAGKLAVNSTGSADARLAGASIKTKAGETMLVYKHDDTSSGHEDIYTLDHLWKGDRGRWSYDVEGVLQAGRIGENKLEAWAVSGRATYAATPKLKLYLDLSAASGGRRGDTILTFNQLYASNHSRFGIADLQGWRNMKGITIGAQWKPTSALTVNGEFHSFSLWSEDDAWYGDNGRPRSGFSDPTGSSGSDVGQELDLWGSYSLNKETAFEGGVAVFKPGSFVRSFVSGDVTDHVFGYLQIRYRF